MYVHPTYTLQCHLSYNQCVNHIHICSLHLQDGYNSSDSFFTLSYEEPLPELNGTSTESTNDVIKITAQFSSAEFSDSSFTTEYKNGVLDLTMYGPNEYANMSVGHGLLGK